MKYAVLAVGLLTGALCMGAEHKMGQMDPEMMKYMQLQDQHKKLAELVGNWNYKLKMWMEPGAQPQEHTGKSRAKLVMNGRFLQEDVSAMMGKHKFQGMSLTGYDNLKEAYQSIWLDNMGTGMMISQGSMEGDILKSKGSMSCPMTKEKERTFRTEMKVDGKDSHTYKMFAKDSGGKEYMMMEIVYSRAN